MDPAPCLHSSVTMRFDALTDTGLAFLLTLATMPATGCDLPGPDEPDPSESQGGDSTGDDPTDASQTTAASSPSTNAATDAGDSTGDDPTEDPTTDPTDDPTTDPTEDPTTDPTDDPTGADPTASGDALCELYATNLVVCFPSLGDPAVFVGYCQQSLEHYGAISADCRALAEEIFACMSVAECDVLSDVETCAAESEALAEACG